MKYASDRQALHCAIKSFDVNYMEQTLTSLFPLTCTCPTQNGHSLACKKEVIQHNVKNPL